MTESFSFESPTGFQKFMYETVMKRLKAMVKGVGTTLARVKFSLEAKPGSLNSSPVHLLYIGACQRGARYEQCRHMESTRARALATRSGPFTRTDVAGRKRAVSDTVCARLR